MRTGFAAAAAVAAFAVLPASAGAAVITPEVVKPQVVTPQVVTPAPAAPESTPAPVEAIAEEAASQASESAPATPVGAAADQAAHQASGKGSNAGNPGACRAGIHSACRVEAEPSQGTTTLGNLYQNLWHNTFTPSVPQMSSSSFWQAIESAILDAPLHPLVVQSELEAWGRNNILGGGFFLDWEDAPKSEQ